ncbi:MAG: T9SS type A sorting domain-containing protein [Bacteroidota bacterium]
MKKRFLPFGLITAISGVFFLVFSMLLMAGQPGNPELRKYEGSRWESMRANQNTGTVNLQDVLKARQEAEALRTKSTSGAMGLNWLSAGPDNYPGLVWSTIYDNTDATGQTLIAGAAGGGIWKSINLGLTWSQMAVENNLVPKVSSIVQAANGTLYVATGVTTCNVVKFNGNGIYSSQNGSTFTAIPATTNNPDFNGVTKLAIAPGTGRLYASTSGGLYYSETGSDWTKIKSGYATDVCVGPDGTVLAAVGNAAYIAPEGNLNGWVTLTTGDANSLPSSGFGWIVFAISPSDANVMYASFAKTDGKLFNIYTSTDKGTTWSVIFPSNPAFEPFGTNGCYSNTLAVSPTDPYQVYLGGVSMWHGKRIQTTGYYNWEIVSFGIYSPWYPISAPSYHHSYMFCPGNPNQMVLSTDGGVSVASITPDTITFKTINKLMVTSQFNSVSFSAQRDFVMGGGDRVGTLAMGYFYPEFVNNATDGYPIWYPDGFFFAGNGGSCEWSKIDSRVAVYSQFKGSPAVRREDFTDLSYANDFMNGVDTVNSSYVPMRLWESFKFAQTRDSVKVFARVRTIPADTILQVESASSKFKFPYHTLKAIPKGDSLTVADPIASRFFFYGNKSNVRGIYMTKDMLKFNIHPTQYMIYSDTAKVDIITTMAVSADLNTLWAGTKLGRLIRVSGLIQAHDSATAIITNPSCVLVDTVFSYPALHNRMVTSISISPANSNHVMFTLGNYGNQDFVYYTSNGNDPKPAVASVQSNLPKSPVYSGLIELHGSYAIVGTDLGVFTTTSLDAGAPQWSPDIQNIGDVAVTDIRQQVIHDYHIQNYGVIYLASYGRGLWMDTTYFSPVGIEPIQAQSSPAGSLIMNPNPVTDVLNISYSNDVAGTVDANVYDITGHTALSTTFGHQPKGTCSAKLNLAGLPSGTYIVKVGSSYGKIVKL